MSFKNNLFSILILTCIFLILATYFLNATQHPFTTITILIVLLGFSILAAAVNNLSKKPLRKNMPETESNKASKRNLNDNQAQTNILNQNNETANTTDQYSNDPYATGQYDILTALPTYEFCLQILSKTIVQAKRHHKTFAVLLIDLDDFNKIHFSVGSNTANLILKQIGNRITNTLRAEDTVARFRDFKFIVILNDIGKAKFAGAAAAKLLDAISQPIHSEALDVDNITASIGVCIYPQDGEDVAILLKNAESAMQHAHETGGNQFEFYNKHFDNEAHEFINVANGLRRALKNKELSLFYQPKFHIKQGAIVGVEALIRWQHPQHGLLTPDHFIVIAEETGFINELGEWAIEEACKTNKHWQDEGYSHISVALNLSAKQFQNKEIHKTLADILKKTGLNPKYLELEINEAAVMQNMDDAILQMNKLKKVGVQIALDHFGIGYTAISYLKLFPINSIKIDRSFIKGIPDQPNDCAITNAFIALVHQLGFEAIAEGVETADQLAYLTEHDCDMIQGYYLGSPVSAEQMIQQLPKLPEKVLI